MAIVVLLSMLAFAMMAPTTAFGPGPSTLCPAPDSSWLHLGDDGIPYVNLNNPSGNTATGYADCAHQGGSYSSVQYSKVRIAVGGAIGAAFVLVDGGDDTYRTGDTFVNCNTLSTGVGYPQWGRADGCVWQQGSPVSIDLTGTPFALASGAASFQGYNENRVDESVSVQCSPDNASCSGTCGGYCGGCSAGPDNQVLLKVVNQTQFDCGIRAWRSGVTGFVCIHGQCLLASGVVTNDTLNDCCDKCSINSAKTPV